MNKAKYEIRDVISFFILMLMLFLSVSVALSIISIRSFTAYSIVIDRSWTAGGVGMGNKISGENLTDEQTDRIITDNFIETILEIIGGIAFIVLSYEYLNNRLKIKRAKILLDSKKECSNFKEVKKV